jgi:hypothetical protein
MVGRKRTAGRGGKKSAGKRREIKEAGTEEEGGWASPESNEADGEVKIKAHCGEEDFEYRSVVRNGIA